MHQLDHFHHHRRRRHFVRCHRRVHRFLPSGSWSRLQQASSCSTVGGQQHLRRVRRLGYRELSLCSKMMGLRLLALFAVRLPLPSPSCSLPCLSFLIRGERTRSIKNEAKKAECRAKKHSSMITERIHNMEYNAVYAVQSLCSLDAKPASTVNLAHLHEKLRVDRVAGRSQPAERIAHA